MSVGIIPQGWALAPEAVTKDLSGGRPGALTIFTTGSAAARIRDLRDTMWLQLTTVTDTAGAPFNDEIAGKPARITEPDTQGRWGWTLLIRESDGLCSSLYLPTTLNDLTREQVTQIAATIVVNDPNNVTHG